VKIGAGEFEIFGGFWIWKKKEIGNYAGEF